jgi:outer membrane protein assembly factor BamB
MRWWPAVAIVALSVAFHLWIWLGPEPTRQFRMIRTFVAAFLTVSLLLVWFLFLSRLRARTRWLGLGVLLALGLALGATVEIRGVTGDLLPLMAWRWSPHDRQLSPPALESRGAPRSDAPARSPQFLGPDRNAVIRGVWLDPDWVERPPREIWRRPIGAGWASFAVADGLAVTLEQRGDQELVTAYDLATGEPVWAHADAVRFENTIAGIGPRSTPTIAAGRVFTMGATGLLNALDLATGEPKWSRDVVAEHGGWMPEWGKSCSPLALVDLVVVCAGAGRGGALAAYRLGDGEPAWSSGDDRAAYASPILVTLAGVQQVVSVNDGTVMGHDPGDGTVLWKYEWSREQPNVAAPLVLPENRLMVSKGYGVGAELFSVKRGTFGFVTERIWKSPRLKLKFTHAVLHRGRIYGLDDGVLACLDPETGERCWKKGRYGHGQLLLVEDLLLIQAENGEVLLVEPTPEGPVERARIRPLHSKTWNVPTLAGNLLLVRNDREAVAFELALRPAPSG